MASTSTKGCACWKCCSRASGPSACASSDEGGVEQRSASQGRGRRQRPKLDDHGPARAARVGPGAQKGGAVDLLERRLSRYRPRRRGDDRHPDRGQEGLVLVHPAARRHCQRRRRGRLRLLVQEPGRQGPRNDLLRGSRPLSRRASRASPRPSVSSRSARPRSIPIAPARRPATVGCWSATPSAFSIRSIRRACCWPSNRAKWRPTPSSKGLANGDTSAAQLGKWEADFVRGMDRMRRLVCEYYDGFSFGRFVKKHPHFKGF